MDRVGLGRALGFGARQAARTLLKVADAATTPSADPARARAPQAPATQATNVKLTGPDVKAWRQEKSSAVRRGGTSAKGLGKAVWKPMARFTSVLWLEVTGFFYALIGFLLGSWAWRQAKVAFGPGATGNRNHFYLFAALAAMFAYFAVTNFIKARRRERR